MDVLKENLFSYHHNQSSDVYRIHVFSTILTVPIAYLLLYNRSLRRFYAPLARFVNISIILNFVCAALVFGTISNYIQDGSLYEIILSRVNTLAIMLGELHQIYLLAYCFGLGTMRIFIPCGSPISLKQR